MSFGSTFSNFQESRVLGEVRKENPKVGDFFIFPAHLQHTVYPFRTDGDFERRSVSFNADFIDKNVLEQRQKEQEEYNKQQQAPQPIQQAPETLTINTEA